MISALRQLNKLLVSLRLTVVLLVLSIVLVLWATLKQADLGVWGVQQRFFHTFFVAGRIPGTDVFFPVFPGGYLLGGLLLINLISAHFDRFRFKWKQAGIWLVHGGLVLLIVGGLLSSLWQEEFHLSLDEGETKAYGESERANELVVIDKTDPSYDEVVAIPETMLAGGDAVQIPKLPFRIVPKAYFPNSSVAMRADAPGAPPSLATQGFGPQIAVTPLPFTYKENEQNVPSAYVELVGPDGSLGTWLVSAFLTGPQRFDFQGHSYRIALRPKRKYFPFSVKLVKFSHDIYPGTDIARNFSSRVHLTGLPADLVGSEEDSRGVSPSLDREALIYMNTPLRIGGLTFYQQSFANNDHTSILQVVRNPSWRLPYVSCALMALGMIIQFGTHLTGFAKKRSLAKPATA